jgi:sulfide:quinone oxidoreductase
MEMDQPTFEEIEPPPRRRPQRRYLPITAGKVQTRMRGVRRASAELPGPVLAYCRTGTRSATLWSLARRKSAGPADILAATKAAGYDMAAWRGASPMAARPHRSRRRPHFDVVIVGGGAAGIAVAASLKSRKPDLEIAIIDPADIHYYQPGWTMVGGGIFDPPRPPPRPWAA